jgi:acyl dehydratase
VLRDPAPPEFPRIRPGRPEAFTFDPRLCGPLSRAGPVTAGAVRREGTVRTEGLDYEQLRPGDRHRTLGRTVSDFEILQFVTLAGFTEPLFMDMEYVRRESVFGARVAPGVLTFALAEGLVLQTGLLHGTGLALLSYDVRVLAPVLAGDTIAVDIEVVDRRETRKEDRGIVTFRHRVTNQRGEAVMEATITRMIRRRGA